MNEDLVESFFFDAMLLDRTSLWSQLLMSQELMNTSLLDIVLFWGDVAWCHNSAILSLHLSAIKEYRCPGRCSLLMKYCWTQHLCYLFLPRLNDRWIQISKKFFFADVVLYNLNQNVSLNSSLHGHRTTTHDVHSSIRGKLNASPSRYHVVGI